jgi:hypothetical protein
MNTQELAQELRHPDAQKLLSGSLARLAYNGHDGFPRVIPIGFYWTGECIVVCTAPTSPKVWALSSSPEVALTIDTGTTPDEAKALLVRISIEPQWARFYDFGAGRLPAFLAKLINDG